MGRIHDAVAGFLDANFALRHILRPFLHDFDVTRGNAQKLFGSKVSSFYLKPLPEAAEAMGLQREVLLIHSPYPTVEPRVFQVASRLLQDSAASGRVEQIVFLLVSPDPNLRESVSAFGADVTQNRLAIPFGEGECRLASDPFFVRKRLQHSLFARDLFDVTQAITDDTYFFGRSALVMELRDAMTQGENIGLFGLRKTGKTSLILKLQRLLQQENLGRVVYLDLQDSRLYSLRWPELLDEIRMRLPGQEPKKHLNEKTAPKYFRQAVEELGRRASGSRFVVALDEIEHIAPKLRMCDHWDDDFLHFWKTIRAVQTVNRHISFMVAGVNASVVETAVVRGHDNPLFSLVRTRYLPAFTKQELRQMTQTLGSYMGLQFTDAAHDYLFERYGGHPLLTRSACSYTHKELARALVDRPHRVKREDLEGSQAARDRSLFAFADHILGVLRSWYSVEYQMLEHLAAGDAHFFAEMVSAVPAYGEHLRAYQLVAGDPPRLTIPFLTDFLKSSAETQPESGSETQLVEIGRLRNELEPMLRRFIKRVLKSQLGNDRWIDPILEAVPAENRKRLQGVDRDVILGERLFLKDLIQTICSNWERFKHLEATIPEKQVTRDQLRVLLEYVNAHREDAHAKPVPEQTIATLKICVGSLKRALSEYLAD